MYKKMGAILLVAGTCIGSGMIALPLVLAKLGMIPSFFLMLMIWFVMYHTSLVNLELNLQAGRGLPLGELGKRIAGKKAELIGVVSLKLLSYSLLAVFIYGGSSIIKELISSKMGMEYSLDAIAFFYTLGAACILLLPLKFIDYFNRLLFITLLGIVTVLIIGLTISVKWTNLPLVSDHYKELSSWMAVIPVVFTSFGFQVIFHTLTNYCEKHPKMLKQTFFWGSMIPMIVYLLWTCSVLSVVYHDNLPFYHLMAEGKVEVGELIQVLSSISKWQAVELLVWCISLLAIATSVIGVGIGLFDSIEGMLSDFISSCYRKIVAALITLLPAYLVVTFIPNAFISVLGFAGMILAIIAVLLPVYLLCRLDLKKYFYGELKKNWITFFCVLIAIVVVLSEIYNMIE